MAIFEGAGVALITPFKANGEINYDKLEEIVEEQIAGGTDAIIACGTTGEASTMTHEEHLEVIKFVCDVTKKRIPVIAGTGSNCTETAVYLSQEAEKNGADGLLVVSPYYNKATQKLELKDVIQLMTVMFLTLLISLRIQEMLISFPTEVTSIIFLRVICQLVN